MCIGRLYETMAETAHGACFMPIPLTPILTIYWMTQQVINEYIPMDDYLDCVVYIWHPNQRGYKCSL